MTTLAPETLFDALEATWPAARVTDAGPWRIRDGQGGGQRVSAATALADVTEADIAAAEDAMRALGQTPLFMIRPNDTTLDTLLEARGYTIGDPTQIYQAPVDTLASDTPCAMTFPTWPMLGVQQAIWAEGGIDANRLDVMQRVTAPKTTILGRTGNTPAATAFMAQHGDIAMLHALEVAPSERRKGVGRMTMAAAAKWAKTSGATVLTLAVTQANTAANALYQSIGMRPTTQYHYRRPGAADQ